MAGNSPARSGRARGFGRLLRLAQALWVAITPSWRLSTSRNPTNRHDNPANLERSSRNWTIGTEGSNSPRPASESRLYGFCPVDVDRLISSTILGCKRYGVKLPGGLPDFDRDGQKGDKGIRKKSAA